MNVDNYVCTEYLPGFALPLSANGPRRHTTDSEPDNQTFNNPAPTIDEKAVTQMLEDVNLDEVFADKETRMKFLTKAVSDLSERLAINHKLQCQNEGQQRQ
ncbi:uncharacterized protein LOC134772980 [Penaeus indicus]|uniref:uncharacterized protein LOC134772980 n=1 Tax=Penaeus indicus TaxID=29960 RepID=UPI00300C09BB